MRVRYIKTDARSTGVTLAGTVRELERAAAISLEKLGVVEFLEDTPKRKTRKRKASPKKETAPPDPPADPDFDLDPEGTDSATTENAADPPRRRKKAPLGGSE